MALTFAETFRDCDGLRLTATALSSAILGVLHAPLLRLIQQLLMLNGGEEHLAQLLTLLHSWDADQLPLKMLVLKVVRLFYFLKRNVNYCSRC